MAFRVLGPKRERETGRLVHSCPDLDTYVTIDTCQQCPFLERVEHTPTRYRLHCNKPLEGVPLRVFDPMGAAGGLAKYPGERVLESPDHDRVERKRDGVRAIVHAQVIDGDVVVVITSRRKDKNGQFRQFQDNVPHLRDHPRLAQVAEIGYTILDGELIAPVDDDTLATTMGIVGAKPERALAKQGEVGLAYLSLFDVVQLGGVDFSEFPLWRRRNTLENFFVGEGQDALLQVEPQYITSSTADRGRLVRQFMAEGFEGAILKDSQATYFQKRAWLKYKERTSVDAQVTGWEYGSIKSKYEDTVGALRVSVVDEATGLLREVARVIPGDDEVRERYFQLLQDLTTDEIAELGEIVELEGQQFTKDGRMRHPRIIRYRADRSEPNVLDFSSKKPKVVLP